MVISYLFEDDFLSYTDMFARFCPPPLSMPKGALICKKGITSEWMYFLLEGMVKVYTNNFNGYNRIIAYMKKNTIFALDCLLSGETSTVTIESVSDIRIRPFTRDILKKMMAQNSDLAFQVANYYCKIVRQMAFDVENQSINDVKTRLANFLYLYMQSPGYQVQQRIDLTQESLASAVNSSRVQVTRVCKTLREDGVIASATKGLAILDAKKLEALCRL